MNNKKVIHIIINYHKLTTMKILLSTLFLIATVALICSPIYLIYVGFVYSGAFWVKALLVVIGLIICRMTKPLSVITGKDLVIF